MSSRYPQFDRQQLLVRPLEERRHDLTLQCLVPLETPDPLPDNAAMGATAARIVAARSARSSPGSERAVVLAMGAHLIRDGVVPHLIDLMERGWISMVACNGACIIHDFEFARIGATTESVSHYITTGEFGLWRETGELNEIVHAGAAEELGLGEAIGRAILDSNYPYRQYSLFAAAYRLGIPVTAHVGIGYDIIYEHPNCDGAAWGQTSYRDFLIFTEQLRRLEGGVFMNFGSAVMGPEVYLKALAMARNVAHQHGEQIRDFTTLVCDLLPIQGDPRQQAPKSDPQYYYRPYKTILVRTVADGGESYYVQGEHRHTLPSLRHRILAAATPTLGSQ